MYDEELVKPMRAEMVEYGYEELKTPMAVDEAVETSGVKIIAVNSVCGCAAQTMRPAAKILGEKHGGISLFTVFAGQDRDATERARSYFDAPPSSPSIAVMKDADFVGLVPRALVMGGDIDAVVESTEILLMDAEAL